MFSPDGCSVAACSADNSIKMWDVRSHTLLQHYPAHNDAVTSISIHPSGHYMLSSSKDATLKLWDLREGRLMYSLQGHSGAVNTAAFSNDGHFFATGGADQLVMVWKSNLEADSEPVLEWGQKAAPPVAKSNPKSRYPAVGVQSKLVSAVTACQGHHSPRRPAPKAAAPVPASPPSRLRPRSPCPSAWSPKPRRLCPRRCPTPSSLPLPLPAPLHSQRSTPAL